MRWLLRFGLLGTLLLAGAARAQQDPGLDLYRAMKQAAATMLARSPPPRPMFSPTSPGTARPEAIDLFSCGGESDDIGIEDSDRFQAAASTIAYVLELGSALQRAGLLDVVDRDLAALEGLAVGAVRDELLRSSAGGPGAEARSRRQHAIEAAMARKLNQAVRERRVPGYANPAFTAEGGCGAGEVYYRLVPSDKRARLHVIKQFYYLTCQARGIDPRDRQHCLGWQQADGNLSGAGSYVYVAELPDGREVSDVYRVSRATMDRIMSKGEEGAPTVLTIPIALP